MVVHTVVVVRSTVVCRSIAVLEVVAQVLAVDACTPDFRAGRTSKATR